MTCVPGQPPYTIAWQAVIDAPDDVREKDENNNWSNVDSNPAACP